MVDDCQERQSPRKNPARCSLMQDNTSRMADAKSNVIRYDRTGLFTWGQLITSSVKTPPTLKDWT